MQEKTRRFLELVNKANADIAAREAAEKAEKEKPGPDPVRVQREMERREKLGQLRARPRGRKKTSQVRNAFGGVNMDPGPND